MQDTGYRAIAIVGVGAVLPDAPNVPEFWKNIKAGRYSISEVTPDRWDSALYYDPDHKAPDKTYSKIGGWVREYAWDPMKWRMAIPPRVADAMDGSQRWAITATREALADYGYPGRPLDTERTAVIIGNAMGGEKHYLTAYCALTSPNTPGTWRKAPHSPLCPLPSGATSRANGTPAWADRLPPITEDSMPGELANCLAGRIANVFNFRGPNFTCDAACASAMAAINAAAEGLIENDFDVALTGGVDRNMGASTFIKFCKIGALSATGSRPYAEGADGFVMGEGAALFLLKRLADAERDGDKIYAVIRGIGASSDGKGKGITAPNPVGQKLCIERAWQNAGLSPATATLIEGHGTSTSVGDVVEYREHGGRAQGARRQRPPDRARIGQIEHRPFEGRRGGRGHSENDACAAREGAAAERALRASQSQYRFRALAAVRQHGTAAVDGDGGWRPARGSERVRIWRDQFPYCVGGAHSAQAYRERQAFGGGRRGAAFRTRADRARGAGCEPGTAKCRSCNREGASARGAGDRRRLRGRTGRASSHRPASRGGGPDTVGPGRTSAAVRSGPARAGAHRHRLRECRRAGGQVRQSD